MKKKQILIVEDERIVAEDIKISLQKLGYSVPGTAVSGEEAVKKAEETQPDLVLMDIVLAGEMDGIEASTLIRSRFGIPAVYLTACSDKKTLKKAKITDPFGYIVKPYENKDLKTAVEVALYKRKMENKLQTENCSNLSCSLYDRRRYSSTSSSRLGITRGLQTRKKSNWCTNL